MKYLETFDLKSFVWKNFRTFYEEFYSIELEFILKVPLLMTTCLLHRSIQSHNVTKRVKISQRSLEEIPEFGISNIEATCLESKPLSEPYTANSPRYFQ